MAPGLWYNGRVARRSCSELLAFAMRKRVMYMRNIDMLSILLSILSLMLAAFSLGLMMR